MLIIYLTEKLGTPPAPVDEEVRRRPRQVRVVRPELNLTLRRTAASANGGPQ